MSLNQLLNLRLLSFFGANLRERLNLLSYKVSRFKWPRAFSYELYEPPNIIWKAYFCTLSNPDFLFKGDTSIPIIITKCLIVLMLKILH